MGDGLIPLATAALDGAEIMAINVRLLSALALRFKTASPFRKPLTPILSPLLSVDFVLPPFLGMVLRLP